MKDEFVTIVLAGLMLPAAFAPAGAQASAASFTPGDHDSNRVVVTTDKLVYAPGEAINVTITYWNYSATADTFWFSGCASYYCIDTTGHSSGCSAWTWTCPAVWWSLRIPANGSYTWSTIDGSFDGEAYADSLAPGVHTVYSWIGGAGFPGYGGDTATFNVLEPVGVGDVQVRPGYALSQNYPNPFNPATHLKYFLPTQSRVRLGVYDVVGRLVATLADGVEEPGYRIHKWNAEDMASGAYFCRLEATSTSLPRRAFTEVKIMLLTE